MGFRMNDDGPISKKSLVLIADDYDDSALITAELIELSASYETVYAKDGVEALEAAAKRLPDAAILDIDMPRLNGMETARALRRTYPEHKMILIAATGGPLADLARTSGLFNHVFIKPYDIHELLRLLSGIRSA